MTKYASSLAIMMSQASISAKPAPNAPPLTAQIVGLVQSATASKKSRTSRLLRM